MGVGGKLDAPAALPTRSRRGADFIAWLGPETGLDGRGKFLRHSDSIRGPSSESLYRLSYPG
jgi:hypothetical protein